RLGRAAPAGDRQTRNALFAGGGATGENLAVGSFSGDAGESSSYCETIGGGGSLALSRESAGGGAPCPAAPIPGAGRPPDTPPHRDAREDAAPPPPTKRGGTHFPPPRQLPPNPPLSAPQYPRPPNPHREKSRPRLCAGLQLGPRIGAASAPACADQVQPAG